MRTLALAVAAVALSASTLAAQSTSTQQPAAKPATHATPVHARADSGRTTHAMSKSSTTTRHAAWTRTQITQAQEGLAKAGFYKGKPTGVLDSRTRSALRAYQKQNKLPVTGRLSDSVLVKLKSA